MIECNYDEVLKAELDMEIQSQEFVSNRTLPIEVSTCEYQNKYHNDVSNEGKLKIYFHSHFLDNSVQNTATTFDHMEKFIHWIYENNLFIKDGIIYDTTDGCNKQYRCENSMWLL